MPDRSNPARVFWLPAAPHRPFCPEGPRGYLFTSYRRRQAGYPDLGRVPNADVFEHKACALCLTHKDPRHLANDGLRDALARKCCSQAPDSPGCSRNPSSLLKVQAALTSLSSSGCRSSTFSSFTKARGGLVFPFS